MPATFPTREELMTMPLKRLRGFDVQNPEQQRTIQDVLDVRLQDMPVDRPIYRRDVPDIQTQEQERDWQAVIDERTRKLKPARPSLMDIETPEPVALRPTPPATAMPESEMAQATGEGETIKLSTGVSPKLRGKSKK